MSKTILVTGANRGLGLGICQALVDAAKPLTVYAASRSGKDVGIPSKGDVQVKSIKLDISDEKSIEECMKSIDSLDVLINNAGAQSIGQKQTTEVYMNVLNVNYRGTLKMCQAAIPKLNKGGRIVNVSSVACKINQYSKPIQERFKRAFTDMTLEDLDELVKEYETAFQNKKEKESGWPIEKPYCISKAAVNAFTAILAREHPEVLINCLCPGWVKTDMGNLVGPAAKTPEEGARLPVRLALEDIGNVSGRYWEGKSVQDTGPGDVSSW